MDRRKYWFSAAAMLAAIFVVAGIGIVIGHSNVFLQSYYKVIGWASASMLFGVMVGLSEILSKYRDEPLIACATTAGMIYLLLNGVISLAAFMLLQQYRGVIFPSLGSDLFLTAIVAGFGAMVVFRAKLFTFRSPDGKDYAIGPAIVLETVLRTIDSNIDRKRATQRQIEVFKATKDLTSFENAASYIEASLLSFQNLTQDEKADIAGLIQGYRSVSKWPEALKILGLGFAFLNLAGDENFDSVMSNLREYSARVRPVPPVPAVPGGAPKQP